jgi:porin
VDAAVQHYARITGEAEIRLSSHSEFQVGAWTYTTKFETLLDPDERRRGNHGAFALFESRLGSIGTWPVVGWVRVGTAETRFNPIGFYVGGGAVVGPESRRLGIAIANARLGEPAKQVFSRQSETVFELTYAYAIGDRVMIQPDVQYVIDPGFDRSLRNSLSAGLRIQLMIF